MPNKHRCSRIIILIALLPVWISSMAQTTEQGSLISALEAIEAAFDVRFSYAGSAIQPIRLNFELLPTLEENLHQLENKTPFEFNRIDERYITVVAKSAKLLCGRVFSAPSGLPLENASIESVSERFGTVTNSQGMFYVPEEFALETFKLSFIGHETLEFTLSHTSADCIPLFLNQTVSELGTVLIKNYLIKGITLNEDASVDIDTRTFGLLPGQVENDVLLITQSLPGVKSTNETISNISIRGGTHDEILILWDDIRMYQSGHFFGLISAFNPDITREVKIYKNGTPARFGEGVSGVIAMQSENKIATDFKGGAGFNLINASAFGMIPLSEKLSLQVSGRRSINSLLETPVYRTYSEKVFQDTEVTNSDNSATNFDISTEEDFSFYDFSTKVLWDFSEKDKLRLNFLNIDNTLEFNETITESQKSERSLLKQQSLIGGISWHRQWSETLYTKTLAYVTSYKLDALNRDVLTTQDIFQENTVLETALKLEGGLKLNEVFALTTGYQFIETGVGNTQDVNLPRFRDYTKDVLRIHSGTAGIEFENSAETTMVNAAIRVNYFSKFNKTRFEPRLTVHQKLGSGFALIALGEFKSQTTTQRIDFESDFLGIEKRRWVLANNESVPVIKSRQGSLGINYSKHSWLITLEGFYKNVEGITASNQGFQNQFQFERDTGSYSATGAEVVINKRNNNYSLWLSYTFLNSEYTFDNFVPAVFPHNLDVRHAATLAGSYTLDRLKLALGFNWRTGKPYTTPVGILSPAEGELFETIQYAEPNSGRLPDYFRTDVSAEYLWDISEGLEAKVNIAVLNVFDTQNTLNTRYTLFNEANSTSSLKQIDALSIGLTPNFSFQLLF